MSHETGGADGANEYTVSIRVMEIIVALGFMATAALVMWDSNRIGAGWSPAVGPESGYFPFYVALIMFVSSAITLLRAMFTKTPELETFVERSQLKTVLQVFIPSAIYVCAIPFVGIYVASAIYIGFFMVYLGKYKWWLVVPVSVGVPIFLFVMFEIWFLVPLPKGPLENFLGY